MARVDEKIHSLFERVRAQRAAPVLVPVFESIFIRAVNLGAKIIPDPEFKKYLKSVKSQSKALRCCILCLSHVTCDFIFCIERVPKPSANLDVEHDWLLTVGCNIFE